MKKRAFIMFFVVTFFALTAAPASAVVNGVVKVGLRYGSSALFSANLENAVGAGYEFGYFEADRSFTSLGWTEETAISMTASGVICMDGSGNYAPSGGGWRWEEPGGDNWAYTQRLAERWYWYEMHF